MRLFLAYFLWSLLASLLLNIGRIVLSTVRAERNLEVDGVVAVTFSLWWFLAYTVLGALILALVALGVRRVLVAPA